MLDMVGVVCEHVWVGRRASGAMHVARVRRVHKGKEYVSVLLRQSYREGATVKHRTLASLTALPPAAVDALERSLRGETLAPAGAGGLRITRSLPHGHVSAALGMLRALGLERTLDRRPSRSRDLAVALIVARILAPASKLATARGLSATTLAAELGIEAATEDELYAALDWLLARQSAIERTLARRHLLPGGLVLLDVTSTWMEGRCCPLARHGYSRDHRPDRPQVVFGLLTDPEGCPVAVEAFSGNTADPATLEDQLTKLRDRFGLERFVLVGDRGMLTSARIERLRELGGIDWVSALRAPAIRGLVEEGSLQLSLFDERDLVEIASPDFPGERLVVCRNPVLAAERSRKREALLAATEADLAAISLGVERGRLHDAAAIGMRVGRLKDRHKMAKHFELTIADGVFAYQRRTDAIAAEAALDGLYVIRTSLAPERLDAPGVVLAYKRLSAVERDFRALKTSELEVRPIHHYREDRVRGHLFLCLLAAYVRWHLERAWAPLLFRDEAPPERTDAVAPPERSDGARAKDGRHRTPDGLPVHGFRSLLAELGTLTRNRVVLAGGDEGAGFELLAEATPLQARALELASRSPLAE
jgi:Transposase DDE domain